MKRKQNAYTGYIAIITVLILWVLSVFFLLTLPYLAIGGGKQALAVAQGEAALQAVSGCAEDALLRSKREELYEGGTFTYLGASCDVHVEKDDTLWTLDVTGMKQGYTRRIEIVIERQPGTPGTLQVKSWLERSK